MQLTTFFKPEIKIAMLSKSLKVMGHYRKCLALQYFWALKLLQKRRETIIGNCNLFFVATLKKMI